VISLESLKDELINDKISTILALSKVWDCTSFQFLSCPLISLEVLNVGAYKER